MFHEKLKKLTDSQEFKSWKESHNEFFLAHAFFMEDGEWQFGFYNSEIKKMVTFICGEKIVHNKEEDILKSDIKISELNSDDVKISMNDALEKAKEILKEKYSNQIITKHFIIIQNITQPIFNITFLAQNFNTVNVKVDTKTGEVISHSSQVLAKF